MGRNAENQGKEEKIESQCQDRYSIRQQCQKASEGGSNPLSSLEMIKYREDMSKDWCSKDKAEPDSRRWRTLLGKIEPDGEKALEDISEQGENTTEKTALRKSVGGSGVLVPGACGDILMPKEFPGQAGEEDASKTVSK